MKQTRLSRPTFVPHHWRVTLLLGLVSGVAYLVRADVAVAQERMAPAMGLTMIEMGAITAWGFQLTYALFQVPAGMFGERFGARSALGSAQARRRVAMACLFAAAGFVTAGAILPGAILAILALSLSTGCVNGAEGPFFMTATAIGIGSPGAAAGMLNLMGNLGGVLSIWLVPRMSEAWGWNGTLVFWSGACVVAALLWLTVDIDAAAPDGFDSRIGGKQ